jgi:hypothetical protein
MRNDEYFGLAFLGVVCIAVIYSWAKEDGAGTFQSNVAAFIRWAVKAVSVTFVGLAAVMAALYFITRETGFSDEAIESVKASVVTEFEKRAGVKVVEVDMMRERDNRARLIGTVKLVAGEASHVKSCSAALGERGVVWRCAD